MIINYNLQTISYYNEEIKLESDTTNDDTYKVNDLFLSEKFLFFLIIIFFILILISGITFYNIGKKLRKNKKKRANELEDDDFDYMSSKDNKNNLF